MKGQTSGLVRREGVKIETIAPNRQNWNGEPVGTAIAVLNGARLPHAFITSPDTDGEVEKNGELIVDAFNTAHETGRWPSELRTQRDRLLRALEMLCAAALPCEMGDGSPDMVDGLRYDDIQTARLVVIECGGES